MKYYLEEGANPPYKAYSRDAGWDIHAKQSGDIRPHTTKLISTGLHVSIPSGYCGMMLSRSSMAKQGILVQGLIDPGYTGEVFVIATNTGTDWFDYRAGDRIAQLVIVKLWEYGIVEIKHDWGMYGDGRNDSGFGSSGR